MAASQIVLSELRPGCCARIVVTRLLRFWEARNAKKGGALMGVDMLLLDDQSFFRPSICFCTLAEHVPRTSS
ncbi:unnamed protein product [Brassica napus]|uniref:(rape) hypothetical protein n=1 Tax=Brassica napus TaxID=3708 RepID=A0A816JU22_BRANA|nr:unnamed protein product [Brassica napus]